MFILIGVVSQIHMSRECSHEYILDVYDGVSQTRQYNNFAFNTVTPRICMWVLWPLTPYSDDYIRRIHPVVGSNAVLLTCGWLEYW